METALLKLQAAHLVDGKAARVLISGQRKLASGPRMLAIFQRELRIASLVVIQLLGQGLSALHICICLLKFSARGAIIDEIAVDFQRKEGIADLFLFDGSRAGLMCFF